MLNTTDETADDFIVAKSNFLHEQLEFHIQIIHDGFQQEQY